MIKKLKLAALVLSMISTVGCRDMSKDFIKKGEYEGYNASAWINGVGRQVRLDAKEKNNGRDSYVYAADEDRDGRFDRIDFRSLLKGDALEEYVNLEKLEQAYKHVVAEGEEVQK